MNLETQNTKIYKLSWAKIDLNTFSPRLVEFWGTLGKFDSEIRTKRLEIRENIIVLFNIA